MNWSKEQLLQEVMLGNAHFKPADMKVRQQYVLEQVRKFSLFEAIFLEKNCPSKNLHVQCQQKKD